MTVTFMFQDDPRWCDVNVVSSLLKSFLRKLPDPIFTLEMYSVFVEMSKIEDSMKRLNTLKQLVHQLPGNKTDDQMHTEMITQS